MGQPLSEFALRWRVPKESIPSGTVVLEPRSYRVIGAAMKVHRALGPGFLERPYQEALAIEFEKQDIPYRLEVPFDLQYGGRRLRARYRADMVCFDSILVELKAQGWLGRIDRAQVENYLRCSGLEMGLLFDFGRPSLQFARILNSSKFGQFRGV